MQYATVARGVTYVADNHLWDIWNTENEVVVVYWVHKAEL